MILAAMILLMPFPQAGDAAKAQDEHAVTVSAEATKETTLTASASLPSAPIPKIKADPGAIEPRVVVQPVQPVRQALIRPRESSRQRKLWYGLAFAGSAGAAFDAWSTRRALSNNAGTEANPLLRPFAHSNALYAATQVSPLLMDYFGKRMMVSEHQWLRRVWWLPQAAGTTLSFVAGAHNVGTVH